MKVLVIGGGGREHAICWKLKQSPRVTELLCAPGNGGIAQVARCIPEVKATDLEGVQVYTAGWLSPRRGKEGAVYGPDHAVCLETQHFPDAVNHPEFPSPVLRPGQVFQSRTAYRFFAR